MEHSESFSQRLTPWVARDPSGDRRVSKMLDRLKPADIGRDLVWAISSRNRQSFGQRLMGVRRVSARDGGPVTARSALARYAALQTIITLIKIATGPPAQRERQKLEGLTAEIEALTLTFPDDPDAFDREARRLKRARYTKATVYTLAPTVLHVAIHLIPVALLPKRQSLPELAAGVVMITDAPATTNTPGGLLTASRQVASSKP